MTALIIKKLKHIKRMSTVQKQMDNINNVSEESATVREDESEQKGIAGLNELLEDDSVDRYIPLHCFMDEDVRRYTTKFRLNQEDEPSVVPDATLNSPKEGATTDSNSSTLETELDIPDNREKEVPFKITSKAENLQSCEENVSATAIKSTDVEIADQGKNNIKDAEENEIDKNHLEPVQSSLVSEEVVPDATLSSLEEGANTDKNSSTLETKLDIPNNGEKEVPVKITSDAGNLQSCEDVNVLGTVFESTDVEIAEQGKNNINDDEENEIVDKNQLEPVADQGTNKIKDVDEDDKVNKNQNDSVENREDSLVSEEVESDLEDQNNEEHNVIEQNDESNEEETNEERETAEEVHDSVEVALPSEVQSDVPKESEEAANSQDAQDENATGESKGTFNDELPPEDERTECKENATSTSTMDTSNSIFDKPVLSPVFKISSSSEAKNVKDKPIIMTARIIKSISGVPSKTTDCLVTDNTKGEPIVLSLKSFRIDKMSAVTTKPADNCGVGDLTNTEDTVNTTKPAESEEKEHESKAEESPKEVQSDIAVNSNIFTPKVILARKVYGNTKKTPSSMQEKKIPSIEASSADTQTHHHNSGEDVNMATGAQVSANTTTVTVDKGKTSAKSLLGEKSDGCCIEKRKIDFATVKRKIEEVRRIGRQDEETTINEIKRIKRETIDVLEKIDEEMKQLKTIYLGEP